MIKLIFLLHNDVPLKLIDPTAIEVDFLSVRIIASTHTRRGQDLSG
ncbi:Uncharacterised protein [Vibrio cholerae]|nr:Uncharacterised protein [Vibrio cholerae]